MSQYIHIGKIAATHGIGGELVLKHALGRKADLKKTKALFVEERKGSYVPWFVTAARLKSETEAYIQLEGLATKEAAAILVQKPVWLTEEDFRNQNVTAQAISLLGYTLIENKVTIGIIEEVIEQPHQILVRINYKNNEALIPLHQETLLKIDHKKQQVFVALPEGLLEIYG
jgi:16S rRNA processing protein RimM